MLRSVGKRDRHGHFIYGNTKLGKAEAGPGELNDAIGGSDGDPCWKPIYTRAKMKLDMLVVI